MAAATVAPPAAAASEFPVLFLTRYGDVPPGYTGIIILPRPATPVNASTVNSSSANAAAEVLLQQPPDFEAALRRAPPPLSIPCRMVAESLEPGELSPKNLDSGILSPENLDPGELSPDNLDTGNLSPDNLDPGDRRPISATKGSTQPDLRGKRPISASKKSNNSDLGTKGSTSISTDRELSSRRGLKYLDWENRKIKEYYLKSRADKSLKKVDWQHLCDTELTGRTGKGVEGQFYKITKHDDDLRSAKRAARKGKDLPPKSGGSEGTEGQDTAKKTVQDPPQRNGVHTSEMETARGAQDPPPKTDTVEDAPPENRNGPVQDPTSSCNGTAEGTLVDKTLKKVQSGGEEDCQEGYRSSYEA